MCLLCAVGLLALLAALVAACRRRRRLLAPLGAPRSGRLLPSLWGPVAPRWLAWAWRPAVSGGQVPRASRAGQVPCYRRRASRPPRHRARRPEVSGPGAPLVFRAGLTPCIVGGPIAPLVHHRARRPEVFLGPHTVSSGPDAVHRRTANGPPCHRARPGSLGPFAPCVGQAPYSLFGPGAECRAVRARRPAVICGPVVPPQCARLSPITKLQCRGGPTPFPGLARAASGPGSRFAFGRHCA